MSSPASPAVRLTPATPASLGGAAAPAAPGSAAARTPKTPSDGSVPVRRAPASSDGAMALHSNGAAAPGSSGLSVPPTPFTPFGTDRARPFRRELVGAQRFTPRTPKTPSEGAEGEGDIQLRTEVWGTDVVVEECRKGFLQFLENYVERDGTRLYMELLNEQIEKSEYQFNVNCAHLASFNEHLYKQLLTYPLDVVPILDQALNELHDKLKNPTGDPAIAAELLASPPPGMQARPFNILAKKGMRELNPEDMDTLISVKGMVIRVGGIVPEMENAFFRCALCNDEQIVPIEDGVINEPVQCRHCSSRLSYRLIHNRCKFNDKQIIKVQETPDSIPEGETPHAIRVFAFAALVDFVKPGDRVEITGVYRAVAVKVNPRRSTLSTVYRTYIDAVHFKKTDKARMDNEANDAQQRVKDAEARNALIDDPAQHVNVAGGERDGAFHEHEATAAQTAQLEEQIRALSREPGLYEKLSRSLAPSIWEMDDVKKGILCLLFGGSGAEQGAASGKFRGEINVLMCGDPGTSKSQLLQYVHKIAPRGIYTSGKGTSAVGLTASVIKDAETKEMVLESGALVLSDRGVCCIDEFDKMSDATRSILHEVMEQQTVSIAKAGIVCTLNARTSILASANPKESRYNPRLSVVENVQIMPTLLSRFDLIYLVLDQPNEAKDRKLAKHLVGLYFELPGQQGGAPRNAQGQETISMQLLTAYISYARAHCRPQLSDEASERLIEHYTEMRAAGASQKIITATPRQLEALIRLSEALAKMTLSELVQVEHVEEAKRLMDVATQKAATDPTTGRIDMDLLQTGHSTRDRENVDKLTETLRNVVLQQNTKTIRINQLYEFLNQELMGASGTRATRSQFDDAVQQLIQDGFAQRFQHTSLKVL